MLILRRKEGESLVIDGKIDLTVLSVDNNGTVSLGIRAPKDVMILRRELLQAASVNREAAGADAPRFLENLQRSLGEK